MSRKNDLSKDIFKRKFDYFLCKILIMNRLCKILFKLIKIKKIKFDNIFYKNNHKEGKSMLNHAGERDFVFLEYIKHGVEK